MFNFLITTFKFITLLFFFVSTCNATDFRYSLNTSIFDSDNIRQTVDGPEGTAYTAGLDFTLNSVVNPEWSLDVASNFLSTHYSGDEFANEQNKSFRGVARYTPIKTNFGLTFLGNISQVPRNRFSVERVNNLRDIQVVAINPSYFIKLNSADKLNFSANAIDLKSEDADGVVVLDISRKSYEYALNYEKKLNATSTLSINFQDVSNDFFDVDALDYDQQDLFLNWTLIGKGDELQIEYGLSEVTDETDEVIELNYSRLAYIRQVNRRQSLELSYFNGVDSILNTDSVSTGNVNQQTNNVTRAQEIQEYGLGYTFNGTYITWNINYAERELKQFNSEQTEKEERYIARINYSMSRLFNTPFDTGLQFSYALTERDFDTILNARNIINNEIEIYSLRYNYSYSSKLTCFISFAKREAFQQTSDFMIVDNNNSNSIEVGFTYSDRGRW